MISRRRSLLLQAAAGGGGFDPASLGADLKAWYDASDATTITATSGLVDVWADKSDSGFDLTGTTTTRPSTGVDTLNSLNVLTFAGDYLTAASAADWAFMNDTTPYWVSAVVRFYETANPNALGALMGNNGLTGSQTGASFYYDDRSAVSANESVRVFIVRATNNFLVRHNSENAFFAPQTWGLLSFAIDPGNATAADRSDITLNGVSAVTTNSDTAEATGATPSRIMQIGAAGNNSFPATMRLAELLIYTTDALADVETYLTTKWGL